MDKKIPCMINAPPPNFEKTLSRQWLEYADIYLKNRKNPENAVMQELNNTLMEQTFLAGNKISTADEVIYKHLFQNMARLNFQEKETYVHLSRWYNTLQNLKTQKSPIKFSRTLLFYH